MFFSKSNPVQHGPVTAPPQAFVGVSGPVFPSSGHPNLGSFATPHGSHEPVMQVALPGPSTGIMRARVHPSYGGLGMAIYHIHRK